MVNFLMKGFANIHAGKNSYKPTLVVEDRFK